jgi:hypothetical protein
MSRLGQAQIDNNVATASGWAAFAAHRAKVTALSRARAAPSRLCVLGAGNVNDVDLRALLATHETIDLVDLDAAAMARGLARQGLEGDARVHARAADLTGSLDTMADWSPATRLGDGEVAALPRRAVEVAAIGAGHPRFAEMVAAVRLGHLRQMAELAAPGGVAVLIADVVSSLTCPELRVTAERDLPALVTRLGREGNLFHGAHPARLAAALASDPVLRASFLPAEWERPWIWDLGPRLYLAHAVTLRRR